jgi:pyridoxamine--pyruvate transaminase
MMNWTAGQADVPASTLRAQSRPPLAHTDPAFVALFARTTDLLRRVYQTPYDTVVMQGDAALGLEAAAASLISPGDIVLNLVSGVYGAGYERFIRRYGGEVVEMRVPFNDAIDPDDVRSVLDANPRIKFLSAVHVETMAGTVNPIDDIGRIAREHGVLTIVDTAAGLGAHEFLPDQWGIDIAVASPKKCLGGIAGVTLMSVSPTAWTTMAARREPLRRSYLSILDWKELWLEQRRFPYTPGISDMFALEATLERVLEVGVDAHIARYARIAAACRAGVRALGLELWPARDEIAASGATVVRVPPGVTDRQLIDHLRDRYDVMISGGHSDLAGKVFHLGHMGTATHPTHLAAQLAVLELSLADLGRPVTLGAGVGAALDAFRNREPSARR